MQSFRVREFVRAGTPDEVVEWRDMWLQRGLELLTALGLPAQSDVAADPFFGRGGKMLAASQREQKLKFEVLVPVISKENPTAVLLVQLPPGAFRRRLRASAPTTARSRTPRASASASSASSWRCSRRTASIREQLARRDVRARSGREPRREPRQSCRISTPASYQRAASLHADDRVWVEKNCYVDIWIEVMHALGLRSDGDAAVRASPSTSRATSGRSSSRRTTSCASSTASTCRS